MMRRALLAASCAIVVLAGCRSDPGPASAPPSAPPSVPPSAPANPSPGVSPAAPVRSPGPARPRARDGRNYRACIGGDCEVAVSGTVTITLSDSPAEAGPLRVRKVTARSVEVRMITPAGPSLTTVIDKGCTTAFYANNSSGAAVTSCTRVPGEVRGFPIRQLVTVGDITGGTAILRLRSG